MLGMDQMTSGLEPLPKRTRKEVFLDEMNQVVPWAALVALIQTYARGAHQALGGRPPFPIETMLRIHCLQLWWNLSDPAMEEEMHERPLYRRFVGLDGAARMSDESTILRFRHLLETDPQIPHHDMPAPSASPPHLAGGVLQTALRPDNRRLAQELRPGCCVN
jgi:transposase, IS5 family